MKYVVFADIHGNQYALRAMLDDTRGKADGYLFLGDICGYYYGQQECMELMRELPNAVLLKGNHDADYLESRRQEAKRLKLAQTYGSSYLTDCGGGFKIWIDSMPFERELVIEGKRVGLFHGNPQNPRNGRSYPDTELAAGDYARYDAVFQGHTHYRMVRQAGDTPVLNPGSLGQPRDGRGFSYCVFDFKTMDYCFHTVQFDREALKREIENRAESEKNRSYLISVLERGENGI